MPEPTLEITPATAADYDALTELWEASVRATHHFLSEKDIRLFRPLIAAEYLPGVAQLYCIRNEQGQPKAFIGMNDQEVEMLFVHPDARGKGLGKTLLQYAIHTLGADHLDVNEQNEQALGFYRKMGFEVIGRDEKDGMGNPFPVLHMRKIQ